MRGLRKHHHLCHTVDRPGYCRSTEVAARDQAATTVLYTSDRRLRNCVGDCIADILCLDRCQSVTDSARAADRSMSSTLQLFAIPGLNGKHHDVILTQNLDPEHALSHGQLDPHIDPIATMQNCPQIYVIIPQILDCRAVSPPGRHRHKAIGSFAACPGGRCPLPPPPSAPGASARRGRPQRAVAPQRWSCPAPRRYRNLACRRSAPPAPPA